MKKWYVQISSAATQEVWKVLVAYVEVFGICWEVMLNPQLPGRKNISISHCQCNNMPESLQMSSRLKFYETYLNMTKLIYLVMQIYCNVAKIRTYQLIFLHSNGQFCGFWNAFCVISSDNSISLVHRESKLKLC